MLTTTLVKPFTKSIALALLIFTTALVSAEWNIDFSRRIKTTRSEDLREPASMDQPLQVDPPQVGFFESLLESGQIDQEIVLLNTEKGFVPSTLRVKKGMVYQVHIVNVNEREKNVSFVLDSFSEHHATYFGKIKTFTIRPQKEGVYRFVSPETSAQGKLVVLPEGPQNRLPASEE